MKKTIPTSGGALQIGNQAKPLESKSPPKPKLKELRSPEPEAGSTLGGSSGLTLTNLGVKKVEKPSNGVTKMRGSAIDTS